MDFISRHPAALWIYRAFVVMMVYLGSVASLGLVWNLADLFMALMAIVNLVAIAILGKYAFIALDDYVSQKKRGILNPEFDPSVMPNHRGIPSAGRATRKRRSNSADAGLIDPVPTL